MSSEHVIDAKVRADTSDFQKGMSDAERDLAGAGEAFSKYGAEAEKASQQTKGFVETNRSHMESLGKDAMVMGGAMLAGLGLAAKAAMGWESAWAGVTKTVDGSPEQMAALEKELRGLATTLPATHEEIAAVAEAAGQLGVKRADITAFTKTMIDLGETTNLTAEEAATSIAQISNVMGTAGGDVDNFGSTLVALGNAGASTEKEILEMATRIAGAGKLVGASEADVLALSNAMASVGIEAQLGGGVMSRVMQRMYADVQSGGDALNNLAKVSGVSAKDFAAAFESDPVRAVDMMVKGLGRVKDEGGNVVQTMDDLGIKGTEETGVILRLAGAGDLLADSLKLGGEAWEKNTALANEAAKRYETTESKVKIAWNGIKDDAIDAGAVLLPIIQGISESVGGLTSAFGDLPAPVQGAITVMAGVTGGAALLVGGLLTVIPKIQDARAAFHALNINADGTPSRLGKVTRAAGVAAAAYAGLATAAALASAATDGSRSKTSVEDFNNSLGGIATKGDAARKSLDAVFNGVTKPGDTSTFTAVNDLDSALQRVFNPTFGDNMNDFWSTVFGQNATSGINVTKAALGDMDKALASMATSGNLKDAAAGFRTAADAAKAKGIEVKDLTELFPAYKDAILTAKTANGETQVSQESLTQAMLNADPALADAAKAAQGTAETIADVGTAAEQAKEQADGLVEKLLGLNNVNLSAADAQMGFDEAIANSAKNLENAGHGVDYLNEKTGEFNQTAFDNREMLNGIAAQGSKVAQTVYDQTGSYDKFKGSLEDSRQALFDVAKAYFPTEKAAWSYVNSVLAIPPKMETVVNITDNNTIQGVNQNLLLLHGAIQKTPDKTVIVKEPMSPAIRKGLEGLGYIVKTLPDGTIQVTETGTDATGQKIDGTARKQRIATITAAAATGTAEAALNWAARPRLSQVTQTILRQFQDVNAPDPVGTGTVLAPKKKRAGGGPVFGPGSGTSDDIPAMLSNGEHVWTAQEVDAVGGQMQMYRMRALAKAGMLPKFAGGGAVTWGQVSRQKWDSLIAQGWRGRSGDGAEKLYPPAPKPKPKQVSAETLKRRGDMAEGRRDFWLDYQKDSRRGNGYRSVAESASNANSFADRLTSLADSGNVSAASMRNLYTAAGRGEAGLRTLHRRADGVSASLEKAKGKLENLVGVRNSIRDDLAGGFSISDAVKSGNAYGSASMKDVQGSASDYLSRVKSFAGKLKALQKKGYSGAIVQEISEMGLVAGSDAADVLLKATGGEVRSLNRTKTAIDTASMAAGTYVTDAMYKGGVNAAAGLVKGLQSQEAAIEKQMLKIGLGMESALKKALGIRSPSKKAELIADNFTGTIVDRLAAGAEPVAKQAGVLGDAMNVTPGSEGVARVGSGRELQYAAPAPAPAYASTAAVPAFSLDGYTLELNADATMGTFRRIASAAASGAVRAANDDLKRGRAR